MRQQSVEAEERQPFDRVGIGCEGVVLHNGVFLTVDVCGDFRQRGDVVAVPALADNMGGLVFIFERAIEMVVRQGVPGVGD